MEIGDVCNAPIAFITRLISLLLRLAQKQSSIGASNDAAIANTPLTSNSNPSGCGVEINWTKTTNDGLFGTLSVDGKPVGVCCTNLKDRILDGVYTAKIDLSPRLGYRCPHIAVPLRDVAAGGDAGLRIHKANTPSQSLGCIFPGENLDGDAVDNSGEDFDAMMLLLPPADAFQVSIVSSLTA